MKRIVLAALAAGFLAGDAAAQDAADDRDAIVRDLMSGDRDRVAASLGRLPMFAYDTPLPDGYVTVELAGALVAALEAERRIFNEGREPEKYLELELGLLEAVAATRHPLTIDVLTRLAWIGSGAKNALLRFGPGVLPGAAALAVSPEATPQEANGALWVLLARHQAVGAGAAGFGYPRGHQGRCDPAPRGAAGPLRQYGSTAPPRFSVRQSRRNRQAAG